MYPIIGRGQKEAAPKHIAAIVPKYNRDRRYKVETSRLDKS